MKRVISFCLYKAPSDWEKVMETNHNKYISGLYQNINLIQKYYPNWHIYLYHNELFDISEIQNSLNGTHKESWQTAAQKNADGDSGFMMAAWNRWTEFLEWLKTNNIETII